VPILGPDGRPVTTYKKASPPKLGEVFAPRWAGHHDRYIFTMPGGGAVMFDLNKLTLADFRTMRDHYQVNATLAVLTFMIHQMDWKIECENKKIADFVTANIENVWTQLIRGISQAFWAGYSPCVLQWENDLSSSSIQLTKVKDLIPEEACVNWKEVEGYAPPEYAIKPKIKIYDGIKVIGQGWPVPVDNTLWYPLLMENGDYYGRKLLRPVFTSWYFSLLMHLFSNRYFERFGEPVPVGRASYEDEITVGGKKVLGSDLMVQILQNLRNRSVVVLPNDRSPTGTGNQTEWDYDIEYLESQMRGADFERYLMRLDEEISLGLFTPLLILRTADVGSYNLGSTHWVLYLQMLNAIAGDAKAYIDKFILSRMVSMNFGVNATPAKIIFRKQGDDKIELVKTLIGGLVGRGVAKPDIVQLGDIAGLTLEEVELLAQDPNNPQGSPGGQPAQNPKKSGTGGKGSSGSGSGGKGQPKKDTKNSRAVVDEVALRLAGQIGRAIKEGSSSSGVEFSFGYQRQFEEALRKDEIENPTGVVVSVYDFTKAWLSDLPWSYLQDQPNVGELVKNTMQARLEEVVDV
jgi:hypothetical protein